MVAGVCDAKREIIGVVGCQALKPSHTTPIRFPPDNYSLSQAVCRKTVSNHSYISQRREFIPKKIHACRFSGG